MPRIALPGVRSIPVLMLALGAIAAAPSAGAGAVQPRIVGGTTADSSSSTRVAALVRHSRDGGGDLGRQFCAGSLISSRVVLTAAHCVAGRSPSGVQVVLGRSDLNSAGGETLDVATIVAYPLFDWRAYRNDIAVLALASPSRQPPVPTAATAERGLWAPGTSAMVAGWGSTREGGPISPSLQAANISVLANGACSGRAVYGSAFVPREMICAGRPDSSADACSGDSGGPLLSSGRLIGLVSWGRGCARPGLPGVYTRLGNPSLSSWTRAATAALEAGTISDRAPRTVVHWRPRGRSSLRFAAPGELWATFQCSVGRSRYRRCTPRSGAGHARGLLRVRAMNLFGGVDRTPVTVRLASSPR